MLQTTNPFQHWRRIATDRKVEQAEPVRYPSKMFLTELRKEGRDSSRVFRRGFPRGISMKIETYKYDGTTYHSVPAVRHAISKSTGVCFGTPTTAEQWAALGVEYEVTVEPDPAPVEPTPEEIEQKELEEAKRVRKEAVEAIKVEVDGMTFDGDEVAQSRMARAITASDAAGMDSTVWVLADNTVATVTKAQLQQALSKAMLAMAELWTKPYTAKAKA